VEEAQRTLADLDLYLHSVAEVNPLSAALANEIAGLQERLDEVYSMVGLGLTAEALSHELHNVADQLAARTAKALARLRRAKQLDAQLLTYAEYVQSAVAAVRRQLGHLAPSLKYVRERRTKIPITKFIHELADFHRERMAAHNIDIEVGGSAESDFVIEINQGKLTQVFDNLLINGEYWLREELRVGRLSRGIISVEVARPFVRLWDNGRGISRTVENRLFTPFVTAKKRGEGRGLGLFITRQLLEADHCTIRILPNRNKRGNLYIFELDLAGAVQHV
jgi:C4-dicarboxylate-specific signal transduction histidine kinase